MTEQITGRHLIEWGHEPGDWFGRALQEINTTPGGDAKAIAAKHAPEPVTRLPLRDSGLPYHLNIEADNTHEADNIAKVSSHMDELMRVPMVVAGAVMPDACPSDTRLGYIPVGGVVASKAIHPGFHSADICCSMAVTVFDDANPTSVLDAGMRLSHFGGGGRPRGQQIVPPNFVMERFQSNKFLEPLLSASIEHFATQGDGNHFFFVGRVASSGKIALVTHHGSRKPGAMLYRAGMKVADATRRKVSPETADFNAWIDPDTADGEAYWDALQAVRLWTRENHFAIHDRVAAAVGARCTDRFWNEHNFVFRRTDGLFYHAKGATPAFRGFSSDDTGLTLIPMNLAEPVLIARGRDARNGLGFAPHGAGRNFSRTAHIKSFGDRPHEEIFAEETKGIDARSFCGHVDISELPSAYKPAATVRRQIDKFGLCDVVDTVEPIGSIMAGDWQKDAPWRKKRR